MDQRRHQPDDDSQHRNTDQHPAAIRLGVSTPSFARRTGTSLALTASTYRALEALPGTSAIVAIRSVS